MPTDLNPNVTAGFASNEDLMNQGGVNNTETVQGTPPISLGEGVDQTSEVGTDMQVSIAQTDKPTLVAPELDVLDVFSELVVLTPEMQQALGTEATSKSRGELITDCIDKLGEKLGDGIDKMDGNDIELLCMLLCQQSKSVLVNTLKATLSSKTKQRAMLNDECMHKQKEIAEKQAKQIKEAEKAKVRNIFKAILGVVGAIVAVVVAAAVTIATGGIGIAGGLAIAGLVLSIAGAACSITSAGLSIGAMYTENEEVKAKLAKANMAIGIAGAVFGIAASVCSGFANAQQTIAGVAKAIKTASDIASGVSSVGSGALDIADGAINIESAKVQRSIADLKIEMEKIDQNIETLSQMLDQLTEDLQQFIKNILECEQMAANELSNMQAASLALANQMA